MTTLVEQMESLKDAIILLDHDMSREEVSDTYKSIKNLVNVKYSDVQRKESRPLLKQLLEAKLDGFKKQKAIIKQEKKRKREDDDIKKERAAIEKIGKKIKKSEQKQKGQLGQLIKAITNAEPTKSKYVVISVDFYDSPTKNFTVTPFNKGDIIQQLRDLTKGKEIRGEVYYSDAVGDMFIPGMRIKKFRILKRGAFGEEQKAK